MHHSGGLAHSMTTALHRISWILSIIAVIAVVLMMLLSVSDVVMRYFFSKPILDSAEMVQYLMVVASFSGLAWCAIKGFHIAVDLLVIRFPRRAQAIIRSVTYFLCLTVVPLAAWQGFVQAQYTLQVGKGTGILDIPAFPFYLVMGVGLTALCLALVLLLAESVVEAVKR